MFGQDNFCLGQFLVRMIFGQGFSVRDFRSRIFGGGLVDFWLKRFFGDGIITEVTLTWGALLQQTTAVA